MSSFNRFIGSAALIISAFSCISCAGTDERSRQNPSGLLESASAAVEKSNGNYEALKNIKAGGSGYFYVLDDRGKVVWHPRPILIGKSFSYYPFVAAILEMKNGCVISSAAEEAPAVFFKQTAGGDILCLSVLRREFPDADFNCASD